MSSPSSSWITVESCPLERYVPAAVKTGTSMEVNKASHNRQHFINVVNGMWHHADIRADMDDHMMALLKAKHENEKLGGDEETLKNAKTLRNVDEVFVCTWLCSVTNLTPRAVGIIKDADARNIWNLFGMIMNCSLSIQLGDPWRNKRLCTIGLNLRNEETGSRASAISDDNVFADDGVSVMWGAVGIYGLVFGGGEMANEILHKPTNERALVDDTYSITRDFCVNRNWD